MTTKTMTSKFKLTVLGAVALICTTNPASAAPAITIHADQPGAKINPAMWGIFFEDINFGADGGLYAELVKNRGFEFPEPLMGWTKISPPSSPRANCPCATTRRSTPTIRIISGSQSEGTALFGVVQRRFSRHGREDRARLTIFPRKSADVSGTPALRVELYAGDGTLLDTVRLGKFFRRLEKITAVLHPERHRREGRLYVLVDGKGAVDLISFRCSRKTPGNIGPADCARTWCRRWRICIRASCVFPAAASSKAACLNRRYQWKKTIGPVEERPLLVQPLELRISPSPDAGLFSVVRPGLL